MLRTLGLIFSMLLFMAAIESFAQQRPLDDTGVESAKEAAQTAEEKAQAEQAKRRQEEAERRAKRREEVFKPTEEISEDSPAPFPIDI